MSDYLFGSVCRIADFDRHPPAVEPISPSEWDTGDYVVGTVASRPSHESRLEAPGGRTIEPLEGERIVGALGRRHATRGIVGDWRDIDPASGRMDVIGGGGVLGRTTSRSPYVPRPIPLRYEGHVHREGTPRSMPDYVREREAAPLQRPVVLVLGTSMSSGKTMSARVLVRSLVETGHDPVACKLTGSGRYHDVLSMKDAGADTVFDFVDAGLPTTVVSPDRYRRALNEMTARMAAADGDVFVVEIGASPLEPYNGQRALAALKDRVVFTLLTASDPYAVVGFRSSVEVDVNLVTGIATNTAAGRELIEELTDLPALNLQREEAKDRLLPRLRDALT